MLVLFLGGGPAIRSALSATGAFAERNSMANPPLIFPLQEENS